MFEVKLESFSSHGHNHKFSMLFRDAEELRSYLADKAFTHFQLACSCGDLCSRGDSLTYFPLEELTADDFEWLTSNIDGHERRICLPVY